MSFFQISRSFEVARLVVDYCIALNFDRRPHPNSRPYPRFQSIRERPLPPPPTPTPLWIWQPHLQHDVPVKYQCDTDLPILLILDFAKSYTMRLLYRISNRVPGSVEVSTHIPACVTSEARDVPSEAQSDRSAQWRILYRIAYQLTLEQLGHFFFQKAVSVFHYIDKDNHKFT